MTAFWQWLVPQPVWVILLVVGAIPIITGILIYALAMSSPIVRWVLASIHVGRRVALAVVLGLFTAAFVVSIVYMAELAWPPADATTVSPKDLQRILPKPGGT